MTSPPEPQAWGRIFREDRMTSRIYWAALAVAALSLPASANGSAMNLVERATSDAVTDTGAKGDSAGDVLTFANDVYDESNQTKVGADNGTCFRTAVGKAWECIWTLTLADGQITIEGPYYDAGDSVAAITGGTGKYMN